LKKYEQAVRAFEQALRGAASQTPRLLGALGHSYALWGKLSEAERVLLQMNELATTRYVPPFDYALVNLGLGRRETAFHYLEQAYKCRSYDLVSIKVDPRFDGLRADPKFEKLLKRLGLQMALNVVA
jgi:serine/threonine-protein kinase